MATLRRAKGLILSLVSFAGILALYQSLIWAIVLPPPTWLAQWEDNQVRAESYAFGADGRPPVVLVGSSIMNIVYNNRQPDWTNVANLAMIGGAAPMGLEVLIRTAGPPGVVVVELSWMIGGATDPKVVDEIFGFGLFDVRKRFSSLQTRNRPVGVALRMPEAIKRALWRTSPTPDNPVENPLEKAEANPLSPHQQLVYQQGVERLYSDRMRPHSDEQESDIRAAVDVIRSQIARLEHVGWRVVLCYIPIDSRLMDTTKELRLRELLHELFPASCYHWAPQHPDRVWATNDGIHLKRADARIYAVFLRQHVDAFVGEWKKSESQHD